MGEATAAEYRSIELSTSPYSLHEGFGLRLDSKFGLGEAPPALDAAYTVYPEGQENRTQQ